MSSSFLPLLIEPDTLAKNLEAENLVIVDLGRAETYAQAHVPGAVRLDYSQIVTARPPVMGLIPEPQQLNDVFGAIGLTSSSHVVVYDDEGGGRAARLLWTLDVIGHTRYSLLNGGLHAWLNDRHRISREPATPNRTNYNATLGNAVVADKQYILDHLSDPGVVFVDTRTPAEYRGETRRAERNGHIPGAVNFDWMNAMDTTRSARLKPLDELVHSFEALGVVPDKEIITYCQSHHRSAHTYIVLKLLGYPRVRGYPGAWSDWGNSPVTPVET